MLLIKLSKYKKLTKLYIRPIYYTTVILEIDNLFSYQNNYFNHLTKMSNSIRSINI